MAVLDNPDKQKAFSVEERMEMLRKSCAYLPNIQIDSFSGLLVDYMRKLNAAIVVRGLRSAGDFEMEFQMAQMNTRLSGSLKAFSS